MSTVIEDAIRNYKMPEVTKGSLVLFYPTGRKEGRGGLAMVTDVFPHAIEVASLLGGFGGTCVRHIGDPSLETNEDFRGEGAWDYTDDAKLIASLVERIDALESELTKTKTTKSSTSK